MSHYSSNMNSTPQVSSGATATWEEWSVYTRNESTMQSIVEGACENAGLPPPLCVTVAPCGSNTVYLLDDQYVVKLYCPLFSREAGKERLACTLLADEAGVPAPQLIAHGATRLQGWDYLVLTQVNGRPINEAWHTLTCQEQDNLVRQSGELMRRLHSVSVPSLTYRQRSEWSRFVARRTKTCLEIRRNRDRRDWLCESGRTFVAGFNIEAILSCRCLLHGDIGPRHVFVSRDQNSWNITGLIDFGDSVFGDPIYDLITLHLAVCHANPLLLKSLLQSYGWALPLSSAVQDLWVFYLLIHPRMDKYMARLKIGRAGVAELREYLFAAIF